MIDTRPEGEVTEIWEGVIEFTKIRNPNLEIRNKF
jgi:hypothetical protein